MDKMQKHLMQEKVAELHRREEEIKNYMTESELKNRLMQGRYTARQRIEKLLDPDSFIEIDMMVTHHCNNFGMDKRIIPSEGVITGYGKIEGRLVFVYSQDFLALGGSFGEMHGKKIIKIMNRAIEAGAPVIGLLESGGLRLHEVMAPMVKYGELFFANTRASGVVPQISAIMGCVAGGQAYSPGLTDFIIMEKNSSMYIAGPAFVKTQLGYEINEQDLGGADLHSTTSGVADMVAIDEDICLASIRELLTYLPANNMEKAPKSFSVGSGYSDDHDFYSQAANSKKPFDMHTIINGIFDSGKFFEIKAKYAPSIICGFARLEGYSVGIVANQSTVLGGCIDTKASEKAARFIRFCDAFNIPIVTLQDSPAFMIGREEEERGIIFRGAKLLHSYAEATIPMITIMIRKAYAGAQIAMGSKMLGADYVFAWPSAEIASVGAETAASIIFRKEINSAVNKDQVYQEKVKEYNERFINPYYAASRQDIDGVIDPKDTRKILICALEATINKKLNRPWRKHSNIPL